MYHEALPQATCHDCTCHRVCTQAEANMKKYGKQLMNELPDDTTRLLTSLCTDWIPKGAEAVSCKSLHCYKFPSLICTSLSLSLSPLYCPQTPFPRTFPASSLPPFLACLHSPYATVLQPWWLHQGVCQQEGPPHSLPGAHDKGIHKCYF